MALTAVRYCIALLALLLLISACKGKGGGEGEEGDPGEIQETAAVPALNLQEIPQVRLLDMVWREGKSKGKDLSMMPPSSATLLYDEQQIVVSTQRGELSALDAETGKERWTIEVSTDDILADYAFGRFLVSTRGGEIVAYSNEGELLWRSATGRELLTPPRSDGNVVLVHAGSSELIALDIETGEERWVYRHEKPGLVVRGDAAPLIRQGAAVLGLASGAVALHNPDSGMQLAKFQIASSVGGNELRQLVDVDHAPVFVRELMIAGAYQYTTRAIDMRSGQVAWELEMGAPQGIVVTDAGNLILINDENEVLHVDSSTGEVLWRIEGLDQYRPALPIAIGDQVVIPLRERNVFLFADLASGELSGLQRKGVHDHMPEVAYVTTDGSKLYTVSAFGEVGHWQMMNP
ncbi:MAG: PQQ-binding-like beta-propeller repeat protein [Gammaproteobacteria bacterium AqS3]|nr:PQQ-binding-like beta-propeller repeat protein [Gammaproteobacteria bacterium AqS3]